MKKNIIPRETTWLITLTYFQLHNLTWNLDEIQKLKITGIDLHVALKEYVEKSFPELPNKEKYSINKIKHWGNYCISFYMPDKLFESQFLIYEVI